MTPYRSHSGPAAVLQSSGYAYFYILKYRSYDALLVSEISNIFSSIFW